MEIPQGALAELRERIGPGDPPPDASFESAIAHAPASRLPQHPLVDATPATRALHARGQSLPDWFALRFGRLGRLPDGVAFPESSEDVRDLLDFARACGACLIPYGGGTSVVGHLDVPDGPSPVLTVSLAHMRALHDLDPVSRLATFGAGVAGPDLEAQLRPHGLTLGHFPQSFEYSTLGGWIVTRSSGQQSRYYGRIEGLLAGARVETPVGTLRIPTVPASSAGIDLREMLLGSEGRLGIVTEATVRVSALPEHESFHGLFFPDWNRAEHAVRTMAQAGLGVSMLRLSNAAETFTTMQLAGDSGATRALQRYLSLRGARDEKCMLVAGVTGTRDACAAALRALRAIASRDGGIYIGRRLGDRWQHNRFRGVYVRNALWEHGYAVDTAETAVDWTRVGSTMRDMEAAAREAFGEVPVHAYTHLSHVYAEGSSVYSTFIFPIAATYEENMERWARFKRAVCEAIVANRATISHQHGVGVDHKPYLAAEKGELGIDAMRALFARFDPGATMNPGKLC
jgi:alkyldihydroxyacetonephosphate synthase